MYDDGKNELKLCGIWLLAWGGDDVEGFAGFGRVGQPNCCCLFVDAIESENKCKISTVQMEIISNNSW